MIKIYQFQAEFCNRNINIFVRGENKEATYDKIYELLGITAIDLILINKFIPLSFGGIVTELNLDVTETEKSKVSCIRGTLREYDNNLSIKIVCCGLAEHVNDFNGYSKTINIDLFNKYHTNNLWNQFID